MKSERIQRAIGNIDSDLIKAADEEPVAKQNKMNWIKWSSFAASVAIVITLGVQFIPKVVDTPSNDQMTSAAGHYGIETGTMFDPIANQFMFYHYQVDEGPYRDYEPGRVVSSFKLGEKIGESSVTAGWWEYGVWKNEEHSRIEIFNISGVSEEEAVAIRFLDELEAERNDCYYAIVNKNADPKLIFKYTIPPFTNGVNDGNYEYYE